MRWGSFLRTGFEAVADVLTALGFRGDERVLESLQGGDQPGRGAADAAEYRETGSGQRESVCEAGARAMRV